MQLIRTIVRRIIEARGYRFIPIEWFDNWQEWNLQMQAQLPRRDRLLSSGMVDCVVDVGANIGEYGALVRSRSFPGPIHSFEPGSNAFSDLDARASDDPLWNCYQVALGDSQGQVELHVSKNLVSSSILGLELRNVQHDPTVRYFQTETVPMTTLDIVSSQIDAERALLKLDVQGYELNVLQGGEEFLNRVAAIECEVSLVPLYVAQPLLEDMVGWLRDRGFEPTWVESGVKHQTKGTLLQLDMTFERDTA